MARARVSLRFSIFPPGLPSLGAFSALHQSALLPIGCQTGRGGGIRTPTLGFGDRWSTVEPTPLSLLNFFVSRVLAARIAKLFSLHAIGVLLPILGGGVVSVFA